MNTHYLNTQIIMLLKTQHLVPIELLWEDLSTIKPMPRNTLIMRWKRAKAEGATVELYGLRCFTQEYADAWKAQWATTNYSKGTAMNLK